MDVLRRFHGTWRRASSQSFAVVPEGDFFALELHGERFGRLNNGLCRQLHELVTGSHVQIKAYTSNDDLVTTLSSWHPGRTELLPVEINIYGVRDGAQVVGAVLSKSGLFLQLPRYGLDGFEHYNPQFLRIEGYLESSCPKTPILPEADSIETLDRTVGNGTQVNDSEMVDSIFNSLSHHVHQREVTIGPGIKRQLLL